jgi:hypothetical protein
MRVQNYASTELCEYRTVRVQNYASTELREYRTTRVQNYASTELREYRTTRVQNYASTELREYRTMPVQNYASTELREYVSPITGMFRKVMHFLSRELFFFQDEVSKQTFNFRGVNNRDTTVYLWTTLSALINSAELYSQTLGVAVFHNKLKTEIAQSPTSQTLLRRTDGHTCTGRHTAQRYLLIKRRRN